MSKDTCNVTLPDGRKIDICTNEGADIFLQVPENGQDFQFFTSNIGTASMIRSRKRLNANDKSKLTMIYFMVDSLSQYSTPGLFRSNVPQGEIEFWIDHVIIELKKLSTNQGWINTGKLEEHDAFILNQCISMFMHPVPVALAFEKNFFQVLSDFVVMRKITPSSLPCTDIAETIEILVSNTVMTCLYNFNNKWTAEKVFKKLDSCGMLEQFIRVTTVPQFYDAISVMKTYEELIKCNSFIKKAFKKGAPCGDVVHAILDRKDGHEQQRKDIFKRLETIASYVELMQPQSETNLRICRYCNKLEMSEEGQNALMQCSRCRMAYYCSRECQVADWKDHKKSCVAVTKADTKSNDVSDQTVLNFAKRYYVDIMVELVDVCDENNLKKEDLLLELDFTPNKRGRAPALKDPPEFKIARSRGYFEGSRPNEPDWFYKKEDRNTYKKNIKKIILGLKDHFDRLTPSHFLCFVRNPTGAACYRLQLMGQDGKQWFTDEAVDAFRSAINDDDFNQLTRIFNTDQMNMIRRHLGVNHGIGMPEEEQIDRARMALRMLGADF